MARQKAQEILPKIFKPDELAPAIKKLERRLKDLETIDPNIVRHNDPKVERVESDIRASILEVFGPNSPEYSEHAYFQINNGPFYTEESEYETQMNFQKGYHRATETMSGLINRLREKLEDLGPVPTPSTKFQEPVAINKVFLVHGRDEELKNTVARFVEKLELEAIVLSEQPSQGRTIIEKFEANSNVAAAIILLSADDVGCLKQNFDGNAKNLKPRPRQNAVLELGYFIGRLGREKVAAVCRGDLELPSDLHGIIYIRFDESEGWKLSLAKELRASGLTVDMNKVV